MRVTTLTLSKKRTQDTEEQNVKLVRNAAVTNIVSKWHIHADSYAPLSLAILDHCLEQNFKPVRNAAVTHIVSKWHIHADSYAPLSLAILDHCLLGASGSDDDSKNTQVNVESTDLYLHVSVEWVGSGKLLSHRFPLLKSERTKNLGRLLHALLTPTNPRHCASLHRVFHGHDGSELTLYNGKASLLEKEVLQLIWNYYEFQMKGRGYFNRKKNYARFHFEKFLKRLENLKISANGPLLYMRQNDYLGCGITFATLPQEIQWTWFQWAQAHYNEYQTCGDLLKSGDLLVIQPGFKSLTSKQITNVKDETSYVQEALRQHNTDQILSLDRTNLNVVGRFGTPLHKAVDWRFGPTTNVLYVGLLIKSKAKVDTLTKSGATPTYIAAREGRVKGLQLLVNAKAQIDKAMNDGGTPIMIAAWGGKSDCLQLLLTAKAQVDKAMEDGCTPIYCAALRGHVECLQLLLNAKAQVDKSMDTGATPTFAAAQEGHVECLQLLLSAKAQVDKVANDGSTPTYNALERGHIECLELLLTAKAQVDKVAVGKTRYTFNNGVFVTAQEGLVEWLQLLLNAKAQVDKSISIGATPTFFAAQAGHVECLRLLLSAKAQVDKVANDGRTPTWMAAGEGHVECLQLLLTAKAQVDKVRNDGSTPTIMAAEEGHVECLRLLLSAKAQCDKAANDGDTPTLVAAQEGHVECLQLLLNAKAHLDVSTRVILAVSSNSNPYIESLQNSCLQDCSVVADDTSDKLLDAFKICNCVTGKNAVYIDKNGSAVLLFGVFSTILLQPKPMHEVRSFYYILEVLVSGSCPQIGFITDKTSLPFAENDGTGDCQTSLAIDGARGHIWFGGESINGYVKWPKHTMANKKCIIGFSIDLDAHRILHLFDNMWHDLSLPEKFSFEYESVVPSLTAVGAVFRVLRLEFGKAANNGSTPTFMAAQEGKYYALGYPLNAATI